MVVFGQNCCIRAKEVIIVQSGCTPRKLLYSSKAVVFGQSGCIPAKVVVLSQSGYIRLKVVVFGQSGCFWAKINSIRAKLVV